MNPQDVVHWGQSVNNELWLNYGELAAYLVGIAVVITIIFVKLDKRRREKW